jgi:hypothetical protein
MTRAATILCSMLIVTVPAALAVAPAVGFAITRSRWTPVVWMMALGAAVTGYILHIKGLLSDQPTLVALLSPLYQLALYTLLLSGFIAIFRDRPRYTPIVFIDNYVKFSRSLRNGGSGDWGVRLGPSYVRDSVFKAIVIFTGIVPPLYYLYGGGII